MRLTPWLSAVRTLGFGARRRQLQKRVGRFDADALEQLEDRTLLAAVIITPTALNVAEQTTTTDTYQVNLDTSPDNGGGVGSGTVQVTVTANSDTEVSSDGTNFFGSIVLTFTSTAAQTVTVRAIDDTLIEQSTQTVSVGNAITSSNDGAYPLGALTSVSVDVLDNDSANVSIVGGTTTVTEGAAGQNLQVTLNLTANGAAGGTLEVPVTADLPGNADYSTTAASFVATTGNGATANIVVLATNDLLIEGTQSFAAQALSITTTATGSATGSEQVDVVDNDTATVTVVAGQSVGEEGGAQAITVRLNTSAGATLESALSVTVTAAIGTGASAGDATFGSLGSFNFAAGAGNNTNNSSWNFSPTSDTLVEGSELATLTPSGSTLSGQVSYTANDVTINDNESATITFSTPSNSVSEGGTSTSFTATLTITANGVPGTGTLDRAVSFDVSDALSGTAAGAGDDYTFTTQSYTYPIGSVSGNLKTVNLTVHEDIEDESDETVVVQFSNLSDGTGGRVSTSGTHTVTILDNDTSAVVFNAPTGNGLDAFRIVRNGANLEIYDNAVLIDSQPVAGITSLTIQGANGENDTFEVDLTGGDIVPAGGLFFNGGTGGTDSLTITGGSQGNVTYNYTNANDGSVVMTAFGTVNYTGLEPIANTGTAADIVFNLPGTADATITLADLVAGTSARLQSTVPTFEVTDFAIPAAGGSITINMGANAQTITLGALTLNATTDLTINGQGGTDVVHINGAISNLDALSLTAETIDQTTAVTVAGTTTLNAGAAGTITLTQAGNDFQSSVSITNTNTASIDDANGITFGAVTTQSDLTVDAGAAVAFNGTTSVGGNLDVQANANAAAGGAISGAGAISVTGTTTLETGTPATATNDITLNNAANDFGFSVSITSANDVSLTDANNIFLGASTITNTLTVSATLQILQSGAISAGATTLTGTNITLTTATNVFGAITVNAGVGAVSIRENDAIVITSVAHSGGSLTLNSGTNAISQTGDIEIGTGDLNLTGGVITLANPNNTFGDIIVNSGAGDVSLRQDGPMSIGVLTRTAGNVILNANGGASDLTQIAPISIATGTIDITAANITLTQANVLGAVTINAGVGNVSLTEADPIVIAALTHTGTLTLDAGANSITQTGVIDVGAGPTDLTGGVITLTLANVLGGITVNAGTGDVAITENDTVDVTSITHTGNVTLTSNGIMNINGPITLGVGNTTTLNTTTLNLFDNITPTAGVSGTATTVNVNNNTAQIQDGVNAANPAGALLNVNAGVVFSENVTVSNPLTMVATVDNVTISGGAGGAALTVTGGAVSATGFYMNTASASSTVNVTGGSLTLRNNAIVESSGSSQAAITVGGGGALNMGVNATSTPGNNSVTLSGAGTLLTTAVSVDASGNYWGSRDLATVEAGISPLASVDFNPYLNLGTNLAGIGFQGDFSDLSAHDDGSQAGVSAITEAYNMLTPVGIIHALTGSFTETVDLGAGVDKAVTFHAGASPGQVVISGDMILTANDTLPIELTAYVAPDAVGPTAESTVSDNFTVSGTVNLGGATLLPIVTYAAQPFERFTIINNLSAGAVVGTFAGAAEGFIYNVGGVRLRVSYVEFHNPGSLPATPSFFGDGNDVSLTVMTPPVLVELTTSGTLNILGTGWVDDFDLEVSGTNQITLRGNDVTNFQFGNLNTQILGPITVTGDINVSLGNSNDRVLLRGVGVGATFDSGNLNIELGSGNDSVSTTDITNPIVLTTGLTLTGDLSILGGTGDDLISLGGLAAADTFSANAISIDTGTGGIQSVSLDRTTVGTSVSIKNGGTLAQTVALGVNGPNSIGRDLTIAQADGASSYTVGIHDTNVGRNLQITNGNGAGVAPSATVTVDTTAAPGRVIGGSTLITNGNNATNAVSLVGTASSLKLSGNVTVKNGNATTSNSITVTDVIDSGTPTAAFTNGNSPANSITFNGALTNTFLGTVAATNGLATGGTNLISATRLSARGVTFANGASTTSNTITLGGALATDTFIVAGNTSLTNGASADVVVNIDRLTTNVPSGNVTIANGASGGGGTDVIIGAVAAANSITGNLTITNQPSTGSRLVSINNAAVNGAGGLSINEFGSGVSTLNIGTTALVTVAKKLDIQDGSSGSTVTVNTATVGSMTYNDLGGGTDVINLASAGTFQNNGVTRLNLGAGSDTVNIAMGGQAIFNDSVFISLGSGNDVLNIGPTADSPAFGAANRFQFDGDGGVDTINASPLSLADFVGGTVPKKLKSKITNFESINSI